MLFFQRCFSCLTKDKIFFTLLIARKYQTDLQEDALISTQRYGLTTSRLKDFLQCSSEWSLLPKHVWRIIIFQQPQVLVSMALPARKEVTKPWLPLAAASSWPPRSVALSGSCTAFAGFELMQWEGSHRLFGLQLCSKHLNCTLWSPKVWGSCSMQLPKSMRKYF